MLTVLNRGFLGGSVVKNPPAKAGDVGLIPGLGRSPRGENDDTFQYSFLENPMDRGAWLATVHGIAKQTWLSTYTFWPVWGGHLIVDLIYISLIISDTEHLCLCLLAICKNSIKWSYCTIIYIMTLVIDIMYSPRWGFCITFSSHIIAFNGFCYLFSHSVVSDSDSMDCTPSGSSVHEIS